MPKIIIAIDGFSSCGKSTTAKAVAARIGYAYIDTGAMYRAVSLYFFQNQVPLYDLAAVREALDQIHITFRFNAQEGRSDTCLNGLNVEADIRKMYISNMVSEVSALPDVRHAMVAQQQRMGKSRGFIIDGRDIGTKVFPDAEVKIFMTADVIVRARRRQAELLAKGDDIPFEEIVANLEKRDHIDTTRAESPLVQAPDAVLLDSTFMTVDEQVDWVIQLADRRMSQLHRNGHFRHPYS